MNFHDVVMTLSRFPPFYLFSNIFFRFFLQKEKVLVSKNPFCYVNFKQDLINLAPRKPDWDLKRDVAKKLEKLERRTQRAIAQLIRKSPNYYKRMLDI